MKLVFAPDSFKGSLSALEITRILERVARRYFPAAETVSVPMADGGEGTVDALLRAMGGKEIRSTVTGPLFGTVDARWGVLGDGKIAVMEMAQASGLPLVPADRRDPRRTTTLGTGEMMARALGRGVRRILMGIGGSATNDGGLGMLTALGARFTDAAGQSVLPVGGELIRVAGADFSGLMPELRETKITVICDVNNPLLGENGASRVYGPQKGADAAAVEALEAGMAHYARVLSRVLGREVAAFPGAGAAGGLGAVLAGVLGAELKSGVDAVLDTVDFDGKVKDADLVITGEGRLDGQSVRYGKVPAGVARRCEKNGVPVAAVVGGIGEDAEGFYDLCEGVLMSTAPGPISLEEAITNAAGLYEAAADRLFRAIRIGMKLQRKAP